jgi:hypothetical protein
MTSIERYSAEQVITAIQAARGMVTIAARSLGCKPQTVRNYLARYPTVADAFREERERTLDVGELALYKAVQEGQGWAVTFLLKTIGRDRGYVETTRNLNLNLTPQDIEKLDDAQLDDIYTKLIDTYRG